MLNPSHNPYQQLPFQGRKWGKMGKKRVKKRKEKIERNGTA